jgi:inner membrane protein
MMSALFAPIIFILCLAAVCGALVTGWWLWRKATLPEGEPVPKWGDLRSLKEALLRPSITIRMICVGFLVLVLTIPVGFIYDITNERSYRSSEVTDEISSSWGVSQTFAGPVISVPYTIRYQEKEEVPLSVAELTLEQSRGGTRTTKDVWRTVELERAALVLPEVLNISGRASTETRSRSIYSALVYTADLKVSGAFVKPDLSGIAANIAEVHWDKATLAAGLTSTKAIRGVGEITLGGEKLKFTPGTGGLKVLPTGFSCAGDLSAARIGGEIPFDFEVSIGGSRGIYFVPAAARTSIEFASEWPHPNFGGTGLPTSRDISPEGFSAKWEIPNLVRNYPQFGDASAWGVYDTSKTSWRETAPGEHDFGEYVVGVAFFQPTYFYSMLTRATKYATLFIALMFLGVVIFESYASKGGGFRLTMVQYGVIGIGLALFYLTLLAVSEHAGFAPAYFIAAALNVAMTGIYLRFALGAGKYAATASGVQAVLYGLLFFIIRMEDYALLAGTALLVAATIALMAVTRNANRGAS